MSEIDFEERVGQFLEACDAWVEKRLEEIASQGIKLSVGDLENITAKVESDITGLIEKGMMAHNEDFAPKVLQDLHHLIFELELKKRGAKNQGQIHRYKDNGQVGIAVVEGKLKPENALLVMELNRAHFEKKGGNEEGVCEDCVCGKK